MASEAISGVKIDNENLIIKLKGETKPIEYSADLLKKTIIEIYQEIEQALKAKDDTQFLEVATIDDIRGIEIPHLINKQTIKYAYFNEDSTSLKIHLIDDQTPSISGGFIDSTFEFNEDRVDRPLQDIYDEIKRWKGGNR